MNLTLKEQVLCKLFYSLYTDAPPRTEMRITKFLSDVKGDYISKKIFLEPSTSNASPEKLLASKTMDDKTIKMIFRAILRKFGKPTKGEIMVFKHIIKDIKEKFGTDFFYLVDQF